MGVAVVEVFGKVDSREVTKRETGQVFEFHNQQAYLHGQDGPYPQPFTLSYNSARDALAPGFYLLTGGAFAMKDDRLTLQLGREAHQRLIPLADAMRDLQTKLAAKPVAA